MTGMSHVPGRNAVWFSSTQCTASSFWFVPFSRPQGASFLWVTLFGAGGGAGGGFSGSSGTARTGGGGAGSGAMTMYAGSWDLLPDTLYFGVGQGGSGGSTGSNGTTGGASYIAVTPSTGTPSGGNVVARANAGLLGSGGGAGTGGGAGSGGSSYTGNVFTHLGVFYSKGGEAGTAGGNPDATDITWGSNLTPTSGGGGGGGVTSLNVAGLGAQVLPAGPNLLGVPSSVFGLPWMTFSPVFITQGGRGPNGFNGTAGIGSDGALACGGSGGGAGVSGNSGGNGGDGAIYLIWW